MERFRNHWPAFIAIALAGLALIVALGGRGDHRNYGMDHGRMAEMGAMREAHGMGQGFTQPQAPNAPNGPMAGHGMMMGERGHGMMMGERGHGGPSMWFFGIGRLIGGLANLALAGMLIWLGWRLLQDRRATATAAAVPPAPTTPAGHDPRVE